MNHKDAEDIAFPMVIELIKQAENNIDKAEALFRKGIVKSAHRHAIEARGMAEKAYKIMQQKLETGETIITPDPTERIVPITPPGIDNREDREMRCQTDWDCRYLVCPMVIDYDTPQCGPDGFCFCGPGVDFEEMQELERLRLR